MVELWKDISGYEGLYKISSHGRVWSCRLNKAMSLKINKGYLMVNLKIDKAEKNCSVHRLVAMAFLENPQNKREVNHLDEDKLNNRVENLQWVTSKENANWGTRNQRISDYVKAHPVTTYRTSDKRWIRAGRQIKQINKYTNEVIATYNSISEVVEKYGYHQGNISSCCSGKRNEASGYIWQYAS
jgi:hypothetical protein